MDTQYCIPTELHLRLGIVPEEDLRRVELHPRVRVWLRNEGDSAVDLVWPAFGCGSNKRPTFLAFSILRLQPGWEGHPERGVRPPSRCGTLSAVETCQVFRLEPGEHVHFDRWEVHPSPREAGIYNIVAYYENDPTKEWARPSLGEDDPVEVERILRSTPCRLRSNAVEIKYLPRLPGPTWEEKNELRAARRLEDELS